MRKRSVPMNPITWAEVPTWKWNNAIHEAGHAVMVLRLGGEVVSVDIIPQPTLAGREGRCLFLYKGPPSLVTVAGYFARHRWGRGAIRRTDFDSGADGDFRSLINNARAARWYADFQAGIHRAKERAYRSTKADKTEARKIWNRTMRRLSDLVRRDPSFERQVKIVAAELCERQYLTGDEVAALIGVPNGAGAESLLLQVATELPK